MWMKSLQRTPRELGFSQKDDIALMVRAQRAVFIHETAQMVQDAKMITHLSKAQLELVEYMDDLAKHYRPRQKRTRRIVRRKRRG